jgi:triosephosphate isomerase
MPRHPIVGGNWKCNGTVKSGKELMDALNAGKWDESKVEVVICPVALQAAAMAAIAKPGIKVALQNCSASKMGAFTGEHSVEHIKDAGIEWVVIGHSERRSLYGETDEMCAKKLSLALEAGLKVIYCIGEKLPEREAGKTNDVCLNKWARFTPWAWMPRRGKALSLRMSRSGRLGPERSRPRLKPRMRTISSASTRPIRSLLKLPTVFASSTEDP